MSSFTSDPTASLIDTDRETDFLAAPEHPEAIALHRYWLEKRGGRAFPDRSDISPSDFSRLLPHMTIVEVLDGGRDFRFRLYGSALAAMTGRDRTGEYFSKLDAAPGAKITAEETRFFWMSYGRQVLEMAAPMFTRVPLVQTGAAGMMLHSVVLPLTAGGEEIGQILGAAFTRPRDAEQACE